VLIAQLADLQSVPTGEAAFIGSNVPEGIGPVLVAALLLALLALHVVTAGVSSLGARKGKRQYAVALLAAMAIHFAYNYAVVTTPCLSETAGRGTRGSSSPGATCPRSREKTIVLCAIDPAVRRGAFSSFLVVGLTSLYDPGSVEAGQIEIGVSGDQQDALFEAVQRQSGATPVGYEEPAGARAAFQRGEVDAVLTATSAPAAEGGGSVMAVSATVPDGSIRTTVVVAGPASSEDAGASGRASSDRATSNTIRCRYRPKRTRARTSSGFTYTVLMPLLLFLPPFISGSVAVDSVTEEIERGTL